MKAANIISLSAGMKTRKNMESSVAPSILADLIISLGSKRAFCLNKYTRKGTERYTLHIWLNKTIFYCDGHFDKHSNMPQAMQLIVQLKKQPWIQKRNLLLFESMAFHQLRILYYCINCAKISIRVFSRFLILFLFDDLNTLFGTISVDKNEL